MGKYDIYFKQKYKHRYKIDTFKVNYMDKLCNKYSAWRPNQNLIYTT